MNNVRSVPSWYSPFLDGFSLEGESFSALEKSRVGSSLPPRSSGLGGLPPRSPSGLGGRPPRSSPGRGGLPPRSPSGLGGRPPRSPSGLGGLPPRSPSGPDGRPSREPPRSPPRSPPPPRFRGRTCVPRPARPCSGCRRRPCQTGGATEFAGHGYRVLLVRPCCGFPGSVERTGALPPWADRGGAPHGGMHRGLPRVPPRRVRRPCFCRTARGFASGVPHGRGVPRHVAAALPAVQTPLGQARLRSQASGIIELLSAESC